MKVEKILGKDVVQTGFFGQEIVACEQVLRNEIDKIIAEIDLSADRQEVGV